MDFDKQSLRPFGEPLRRRRDYGEPGSGLGLAAKELCRVARLLIGERQVKRQSKAAER
jgi:hypothetical protein